MDILFIDEIADELRVSKRTVYTLLNGTLSEYTFRLGKRYAIQRPDLQKYIDKKKGVETSLDSQKVEA